MSRAGEDEVRAVIKTVSTLDITPFIQAASDIVDYVDSCDTAGTLSIGQLHRIEVWLAAHLYHCRDHGYAQKKSGDASARFQGEFGMGLDGSHWGQMAKRLDVTGCLAKLDEDAKSGKRGLTLSWLGLPPSEQTDYVDRD